MGLDLPAPWPQPPGDRTPRSGIDTAVEHNFTTGTTPLFTRRPGRSLIVGSVRNGWMAPSEVALEAGITQPNEATFALIRLLLSQLISKANHHPRKISPPVGISLDSRCSSMFLPETFSRAAREIMDVVCQFDIFRAATNLEDSAVDCVERPIAIDPDHIDEEMILHPSRRSASVVRPVVHVHRKNKPRIR